MQTMEIAAYRRKIMAARVKEGRVYRKKTPARPNNKINCAQEIEKYELRILYLQEQTWIPARDF